MYRKGLTFFILIILAILYSGCSSGKFISPEKIQNNLKLERLPEFYDHPEDDAITLLENHDVSMKINSDWDLETYETVHIVKKLFKNLEENVYVQIQLYDKEYLMDIAARTIKTDGTPVELKEEDFYTITGEGDEYEFYSDTKKVRFTFPAVEKNSIIEYVYTIRRERPFLMDYWEVQSLTPKLINTYKLTLPAIILAPKGTGGAGWSWNYRSYNCELQEPTFQKNVNPENMGKSQSVSFEWTVRNVPGFKKEPMMPPALNFLQYVKFAPSDFATWDDISKWYYERCFKPQLIITDEIKSKAQQITEGMQTEAEKIDTLFKFVQSIRYFAISMNNSGIVPHTPESILRNNYGDCKDKSILLMSLLQSCGIKSKPVLVRTADRGTMDINFPSWNFNHMILKVQTASGKDYWLDGTANCCPLGQIPDMDEGVNALVLNDDGTSKIEVIPLSNFKENTREITVVCDLKDKTKGVLDVNIAYSGEYDLSYRNFFLDKTQDEIQKYCKSLVANDYLNASFSNCTVSLQNGPVASTTLKFQLSAANLLQEQGNISILNFDPFTVFKDMTWLLSETREYPVEFDCPYTIKKNFEILLPEDGKLQIRNLPSDLTLSSEDIFYKRHYEKVNPGKINMTEVIIIKKKRIIPMNYPAIRESFEKIKNKSGEKLILSLNE